MNRRETIKAMMAASGSLVALPSWAKDWSRAAIATHKTSFPADLQATLAAVVDTIIPHGNNIGALSVGVDKFLQKLIDDCFEKEVQDNIKRHLQLLEESSHALYQKSFNESDQVQREEMLLKFSVSEDPAQQDFFKVIKSETIRGFNTSREVMVNYLHFRQVPGHYYGCVDVNA